MLSNFILFQVGWFACVLGAAYGYPVVGPAFAVVALTTHLWGSAQRMRELVLVATVAVAGSATDTALTWLGALQFQNGGMAVGLLPAWMVALWLLFGTTLDRSLRWLQGRPLLGFLLGGIVGPLAYLGGERLGALEIGGVIDPGPEWFTGPLLIGIAWALLLPAGAALARRLRSSREASTLGST